MIKYETLILQLQHG